MRSSPKDGFLPDMLLVAVVVVVLGVPSVVGGHKLQVSLHLFLHLALLSHLAGELHFFEQKGSLPGLSWHGSSVSKEN